MMAPGTGNIMGDATMGEATFLRNVDSIHSPEDQLLLKEMEQNVGQLKMHDTNTDYSQLSGEDAAAGGSMEHALGLNGSAKNPAGAVPKPPLSLSRMRKSALGAMKYQAMATHKATVGALQANMRSMTQANQTAARNKGEEMAAQKAVSNPAAGAQARLTAI